MDKTTDENFIGYINPLRYRGYYYDSETGLYYLNARYYDPEVGRFINADGTLCTGLTLFSYTLNNPINFSDIIGQDPSLIPGFEWDSEQNIRYSKINAWQRYFGYCKLYDFCAPFLGMFFNTVRIKFNYNNKDYMIQFWKGYYGPIQGAGGEIGIYIKKGFGFYRCANDDEMLTMQMSLFKNGEEVFHREVQKHWWLTGFKGLGNRIYFGAKCLTMEGKITFNDIDMRNAFCKSVDPYIDLDKLSGNTVSFRFSQRDKFEIIY